MNITNAALSRIDRLLGEGESLRIQATGGIGQGYHVDLIFDTEPSALDVTMSSEPLVIADFSTVAHLTDRTIDFDFSTEEFVIGTT